MRALQAIPPRAVNNPSLPSPGAATVRPIQADRQPLCRIFSTHYSWPPHGHLPGNTRHHATGVRARPGLFPFVPQHLHPHFSAQWNIALSVKNPSKLIAVKYTHMKLLLSFDGQLALSRPGEHVEGREVTIDVVVKAKRRLHLGLWWVAVFDVYFSCMDVTFTAPTDSKSGGDWMILRGTLSCTPDTFTILCYLLSTLVDEQHKINEKLSMLNIVTFSELGPPGWGGDDWSRWWYFPFVLVKSHAAPAIRACRLAWPEEAYDEDMYGMVVTSLDV
ncbi:hypothetical protein NL676_029003 [Syzygium grande]|nr:hypothetical protein NL676_029003 [Syzygium grande]